MNRKYITVLVIALLLAGFAFSGCTDNGSNEDDSDGDDNGNGGGSGGLSGTATYTGTWEGTVSGDAYSGTVEMQVNFDEGDVTGSFSGDASGDIQGSVSDGTINAEGQAGFGAVEWSGDFASDGGEVSGDWELAEGSQYGSGTWQATEE